MLSFSNHGDIGFSFIFFNRQSGFAEFYVKHILEDVYEKDKAQQKKQFHKLIVFLLVFGVRLLFDHFL